MARKAKYEPPRKVELTPEIISQGLVKLRRRIQELEEFDVSTIQERWDSKTKALTTKINDTLAEIYDPGTIEYSRYHIDSLNVLPIRMGFLGRESEPLYKVQQGYKKGIEDAKIKLQSLVETLDEKLSDFVPETTKTVTEDTFWNDIHPKIISITRSRFESTHYADAVESALKEINNFVKDIVRRKTSKELDGVGLMRMAFSLNNPIIVLDDLSTESGKNAQQGYMDIFAGSMTGIRNPKAHENLNITKERAIHFIYLASLLMYKIDERL